MMYNENQTKKAMKFLREAGMIDTKKELGGVLVTICNYEFYQDPKNYERTTKDTRDRTIEEPLKNHTLPYNNKNEKNEKNEEEGNGDIFFSVITNWLEYKKERRESYSGKKSIEQFRKKLIEYSGGSVEKADLIIKESMSNNWAGIFPLKNSSHPNGRKKITLSSIQGSHSFELTDDELAEKTKSGYWKKL